MAVIHPEYLSNSGNHGYDSRSVDIAEFKSNKKKDDGKEVEKEFHRVII
jgi:hypothetical protein